MAKRKHVGSILIGTSIALGLFALAAAIVWWQQGMNALIGALVFILYGIGQWMTVVYWQRIQADWETTGEALGRLQQAVTDIPAALETNLKAIATRLTEGQAQALSKLQAEVNEGARATLENGARQIGDSLAGPLQAMGDTLKGFAERVEAQSGNLQTMAKQVGEEARGSVAKGAELVSASLDRNLKQPLAALEEKLLAWTRHAEAQTDAARDLGEELRTALREGREQSARIGDALGRELQSAVAAQAAQSEKVLAGFAERAEAVRSEAEARLAALQAALLEEMASRLQAARDAQGEAQERLAERILVGFENEAKAVQEAVARHIGSLASAGEAQAESLRAAAGEQALVLQTAAEEQIRSIRAAAEAQTESLRSILGDHARAAQTASEAQSQALSAAAADFVRGLAEIREAASRNVAEVEAKASAGLEAQSQLGLEVAAKVSDLAERMRQGSQETSDLIHASQINQTEMQAGVAMLNAGLSSILERLEKQAEAGDGYQTLLAELGKALSDFQERSAEILVENAMKTQEILMEVLRGQEGRSPETPETPEAPETALAGSR